MNPDDTKFEQLSPVLELMYLMVTNMQKYLKVYAEDTKLESLTEYKETYQALQSLKSVMDRIYGIEDTATQIKAPKAAPVQAQPAAQPQSMPQSKPSAFNEMQKAFGNLESAIQGSHTQQAPAAPVHQAPQQVQTMPTAPVMPQMPAAQSVPNPFMSEHMLPEAEQHAASIQQQPTPAPMQQMPTQPAAPQATSQTSEIDSILAELRKLQSGGSNQNGQ